MLQGKLCGLCGNNNYDTSDDMMTLDRQLQTSSRLFVMDNLLPSSYCNANDFETQLRLRHTGTLAVHNNAILILILKTLFMVLSSIRSRNARDPYTQDF